MPVRKFMAEPATRIKNFAQKPFFWKERGSGSSSSSPSSPSMAQ